MTGERPVIIANCSGFYGDRLSAAREMVEGGPIDVLTGDWLAELTMLILWKAKARNADAGYATTFLTQMEQVLGTCVDRGIKVVTNAGGLNPAGCAVKVRDIAERLGVDVRVAHIEGDDLIDRIDGLRPHLAHLDTGAPLTADPVSANAYLGGWGIAAALDAGADVVVCPRVTDAALVVGPAAWWWGWAPTDWDRLAGAVAAGHVIECGPQATGGNFAFFGELPDLSKPLGFPIAEVDADGSAVITKHPGTGGAVTVDTVTAQLLYEIGPPAYANPDVVTRFDTIRLDKVGPDRVRISGTRGEPAPPTTKVAINYDGGFRNRMTFVLTGLDQEAKAAWVHPCARRRHGRRSAPPGRRRDDGDAVRAGRRATAPTRSARAACCTCRRRRPTSGRSGGRSRRRRSSWRWPASPASSRRTRRDRPRRTACTGRRSCRPRRSTRSSCSTTAGGSASTRRRPGRRRPSRSSRRDVDAEPAPIEPGTPLGEHFGARSGDKGGNANVGVWARDDAGYAWLAANLTAERVRELLPEAGDRPIRRYELPNLRALNFVLVGYLGEGVASSTSFDPQAKGLGEYLRSRRA